MNTIHLLTNRRSVMKNYFESIPKIFFILYKSINLLRRGAFVCLAMLCLLHTATSQQNPIELSPELNQQLDFMLGKGQLLMAMDRPSEEELAERLEWLADVRKKHDAGTLTEEEVMAIKEVFTKITVGAITYWECNIGMDKEACKAIKNDNLKAYKKGIEKVEEANMQGNSAVDIKKLIKDFSSAENEFTIGSGGKWGPFKIDAGTSQKKLETNTFSYNGASHTINYQDFVIKAGTIDKSTVAWSVSTSDPTKSIISFKNKAGSVLLEIGMRKMAIQHALLSSLGSFQATSNQIDNKVKTEIATAQQASSRDQLIELINYATVGFVNENFNPDNCLNFTRTVLEGNLNIDAEKAFMLLMQTFQGQQEIGQLHTILESESSGGKPYIVKIINDFSDINPFGINEDHNEVYFEKLLISQWTERYSDQLPSDAEITSYHATYPASVGSQRFSWWENHFDKSPASITFTKGYQARDKTKTLVGLPQEHKLLSSTVPYYLISQDQILFLPAIYGYMQNDWESSRTAETTIEVVIALIGDLATDGLVRWLRTAKYVDEAVDVVKLVSTTPGSGVLRHLDITDLNNLTEVTTTVRSGGVRAINNVKNLVNDGKALVIKPIDNSALASKVDDYISAYKTGNSKLQGELGEEISEMLAREIDSGPVLNIKVNESGHGFDAMLFETNLHNPTVIKAFESKPLSGTSVELPGTNTGTQMSGQWKTAKINEMLQSADEEIRRLGQILDDNEDLIEGYVMTIDKDLKQVIFLKLDDF